MLKTIRIKTAIAAGAGVAAAMFATPAAAGTQSSNLGVSATVAANCTISTTALAFGSIDTLSASAVNGTGGVAIACTNGSTWTATADVGTGAGATFAARRMTSGANTLSYSLFTDAGRTTVWGNGTNSTGVITSTGTGSTQNITIYGQIPGSQTGVPAGAYSDTVAVTVTY
ncbi:MAG TPA: spore coat protein U domain-containing protein [Allosphingosinicella sp.]